MKFLCKNYVSSVEYYFKILFIYLCVCLCVHACVGCIHAWGHVCVPHELQCLQDSAECMGSPDTVVPGGCKQCYVDVGTPTWVMCKTKKWS